LRDRLNSQYLVYALKSNWIKDRMENKSRGDMIPHIVLREIRAFPIPLPPLTDQDRIVRDLDKLQSEITTVKRVQAETAIQLDALLPSVLSKAFAGEL
jgi:type I restriction enzyme S subunit